MFDFFTSILNKAVSAVASVIVAIGLMSAPVPEIPAPVTLIVEEVREVPLVKVKAQEEKTPQAAQEKKKTAFVAAVNAVVIQKPAEPVVIKKQEEPKIEIQEAKIIPALAKKKEGNPANIECALMNSFSKRVVAGTEKHIEDAVKYYETYPPADAKVLVETQTQYASYMDSRARCFNLSSETNEGKNEKAKAEAERVFLMEWRENPARKAIDAFLSDPTIQNFQKFCMDAKNIDGFTTKKVLNADRTAMVEVPNKLSEENQCPILENKNYQWVTYTDDFLLPLLVNSSESDEIRKAKIQYNEKIKSLSEYKIFAFNGRVSKYNGTGEWVIYTRPDEIANALLARCVNGSHCRFGSYGVDSLDFIVPEQILKQPKINFCARTATYTAVYTEDYRVREQKMGIGGGFCEEATKVIPPEETAVPQGTVTEDAADDGSEFVKLTFTSPDGFIKKTQFFQNPKINKPQIDALVDSGWKIADFRLSRPVIFGSR